MGYGIRDEREGAKARCVMRNHGKALKRLIGNDTALIHIEPYFPAGMDREGKIKPLDWGNVIENIK